MKVFVNSTARFLRFIGRTVLMVTGWVTIMAMIAVTVPTAYFVWRAYQPMDLPHYNGLTYTQFTDWRVMLCADRAAMNENIECKSRGMVIGRDIFATALPAFVLLRSNPEVYASIPIANFLPGLWDSFESNMWLVMDHQLRAVGARVPSPEQLMVLQAP
jgi:hypothetical protein